MHTAGVTKGASFHALNSLVGVCVSLSRVTPWQAQGGHGFVVGVQGPLDSAQRSAQFVAPLLWSLGLSEKEGEKRRGREGVEESFCGVARPR